MTGNKKRCECCKKLFIPAKSNYHYCSIDCLKKAKPRLDQNVYNPFLDEKTTLKDEFSTDKEYRA